MEFVVLPDHPATGEIVARLPAWPQTKVLPHDSGRPWLVGRWSDENFVWAAEGRNRLALFGDTTAEAAELANHLRQVRVTTDLDSFARSVPGCFHMVSSLDGRIRVQGSVSTACQFFYGSVSGITVAAERPQTIAELIGLGVDEELMALQMLAPFGPPWPLSGRCVWRGVESLPGGYCLEIGRDAIGRARRWWTAPDPEIPLGSGVAALRQALIAAVDSRTCRGAASADLSGGMDSSSLCFLATRHGRPLTTVHYASLDPSNDDERWADHCSALMPTARHVRVRPGEAPVVYAELENPDPDPDTEAPLSFIRRAITEHLARLVAGQGATKHIRGTGGDELFQPSTMCLHALVRQHPLASVPQIRATKSMLRWTWGTTIRNLLSTSSYPGWLATCAGRLTVERRWGKEVDWEIAARMPPWATPDAVDSVRRLLADAASQRPHPLAALPVHHEMLRLTQVNGTMIRRSSRIGARFGVSFQAPYLDDQVLEAAMSIRLVDRMLVGQAKPVLAAAMLGITPDDLLARKNKGDASPELYAGLRRYHRELRELCDDSYLVRMGLADHDTLRAVVLGLHADSRPLMPFESTFACELWLRSLSDAARPAVYRTAQPIRIPASPNEGA